jgi:hypothetical protein
MRYLYSCLPSDLIDFIEAGYYLIVSLLKLAFPSTLSPDLFGLEGSLSGCFTFYLLFLLASILASLLLSGPL